MAVEEYVDDADSDAEENEGIDVDSRVASFSILSSITISLLIIVSLTSSWLIVGVE